MLHRSHGFVLAASGLVLLSALGACKDKPADPPAPAPPPPVVAPYGTSSAAAPTASAGISDSVAAASGKMAHCPSTVEGSKTEIKDTKTGVEIIVTGKDAAEIRSRAKFLAQTAKDTSPDVQHNGSGEGGGSFGRCPVVLRRTTIEASDVEGGAKIAVSAKDPKEADWLRRETKERYADLAKPGAAEAGQKHMANCPSAVKGAKTAIKDGKDAVEVTVTAADEPSQKDIRERAKRLVEAAKLDPKTVEHTGHGAGGGELGRCPIVLVETTVTAKDVAGGTLVTVKPAKGDQLAKLKKEIASRSAAF